MERCHQRHPRSTGSHRLRSGCELTQIKLDFSTRGSELTPEVFDHLKALYMDRDRLVAVAKEAMKNTNLNVPLTLDNFEVTKETLAGKLNASEPNASNDQVNADGAKKTSGKKATTKKSNK